VVARRIAWMRKRAEFLAALTQLQLPRKQRRLRSRAQDRFTAA
jgi:hypothetical protein